jgi:hypothetical protein
MADVYKSLEITHKVFLSQHPPGSVSVLSAEYARARVPWETTRDVMCPLLLFMCRRCIMFVLLREFSQNHTRKPSQSAFVRWENAARGRIPQNSLRKRRAERVGCVKKVLLGARTFLCRCTMAVSMGELQGRESASVFHTAHKFIGSLLKFLINISWSHIGIYSCLNLTLEDVEKLKFSNNYCILRYFSACLKHGKASLHNWSIKLYQ